MKKGSLLVILGVTLVVSGCTSSDQDLQSPSNGNVDPSESRDELQVGPNDVVTSYVTSLTNGDIDSAYNQLSSEIRSQERTEILQQKQNMERIVRQKQEEIEVGSIETVSNTNGTASVEAELDSYVMGEYVESKTVNIELKAEDGEWKLNNAINPYIGEDKIVLN